MPFIPAVNVARVEVRLTQDAEQVENTFHFLHTSAPNQGDLDSLTNAVYIHWRENMLPIQAANVTLREVYARVLTTQQGLESTSAGVPGDIGELTSPPMPNSTTIALSLRTGFSGRSSRGRVYWVGTVEDMVTQNRYETASLTLIKAAFDGMVGPAAVAAGWIWVVTSYRHNGAPRAAAQSLTITQTLFTDNVVDSQRRRLPNH